MSTTLTVTFIIYYELFAKTDPGLSFFYLITFITAENAERQKFLSVASVRESINTRTDAIYIHTFLPRFRHRRYTNRRIFVPTLMFDGRPGMACQLR